MNKLFITILAVALSGATAFAQTLEEGFYRVQNNASGRYLYVRDSKGDVSTLGADMGAIELWPSLEDAVSDPGSVIYLKPEGGVYDLMSQGTGVHQLTGAYMSIVVASEKYLVYSNGQYLYEIGESDTKPGMGMIGARTNSEMPGKSAYRVWNAPKINSGTDNYFGFKPTVTAKGKYYAPFYADFSYQPGVGMTTWYVSNVDKEHAIAVIKKIEGTVAKRQAVFVECAGQTPSQNVVDLTLSAGNSASGNVLKGVFFDNGDRSALDHTNIESPVTLFDPQTMRILGTDEEGNLAFVSDGSDLTTLRKVYVNGAWDKNGRKAIPHNHSYLPVASDCPATLKVMTEAEYDEYLRYLAGLESVRADEALQFKTFDVYGRPAETLRKGTVYIRDRKIIVTE